MLYNDSFKVSITEVRDEAMTSTGSKELLNRHGHIFQALVEFKNIVLLIGLSFLIEEKSNLIKFHLKKKHEFLTFRLPILFNKNDKREN
jgi:hypothetical protein